MAASRALRRLLRVLELEEEQYRTQMEAALNDLKRLEKALTSAGDREREGRRLVTQSATTGELTNRVAGLEESRLGGERAAMLKPRIADAEAVAGSQRKKFLGKRVERRQTETVVKKAEVEETLESERRSQRALDDWFLRQIR
jgi:flagellar biosynthesis chaperone FliJ